MKMKIKLDDNAVATLTQFGSLSDVVNKILDEDVLGDITSLPSVGDRGGRWHTIDVKNAQFITFKQMNPNDPRYSLHKVIYNFLDNEMFAQLNWEPVDKELYKTPNLPYDIEVRAEVNFALENLNTALTYIAKAMEHISKLK